MKIEKLSEKHINLISDLFKEQFKLDFWTDDQILGSINNPSTIFYGTFDKTELVCCACVMESLDYVDLLKIATKSTHKRMGIATDMLKHIISTKKADQKFMLEVRSKNLPAINLYKSLGFKQYYVREKYYKDQDDAICMELV